MLKNDIYDFPYAVKKSCLLEEPSFHSVNHARNDSKWQNIIRFIRNTYEAQFIISPWHHFVLFLVSVLGKAWSRRRSSEGKIMLRQLRCESESFVTLLRVAFFCFLFWWDDAWICSRQKHVKCLVSCASDRSGTSHCRNIRSSSCLFDV